MDGRSPLHWWAPVLATILLWLLREDGQFESFREGDFSHSSQLASQPSVSLAKCELVHQGVIKGRELAPVSQKSQLSQVCSGGPVWLSLAVIEREPLGHSHGLWGKVLGECAHQHLVLHCLEVFQDDQALSQLQHGYSAGQYQQGPFLGGISDLMVFEMECQVFHTGLLGFWMGGVKLKNRADGDSHSVQQ